MADPVLASMVHALGLETARHYTAATPQLQAYRDRWAELAKFRDGPVNPQRVEVSDPAEMASRSSPKRWNWAQAWSASAGYSLT